MHTSASRSFDVASLLLAGLLVGLVGPLLAGAGDGRAALVTLGGLVLVATALVRWRRRTPRPQARSSARDRVAGAV